MIDSETKAKLARRLTGALHQAPENPELFANVVRQVVQGNRLHVTDLAITIGDTTRQLAEQLRAARRNAPPTYDNLIDLASARIAPGRNPERSLAEALGVPLRAVEERKRDGRVPRAWFEKINSLSNLDETSTHLGADTKRAVQILAENGYAPEAIHRLFQQIRSTRAGVKQIANVMHGIEGSLSVDELNRMQDVLFANQSEPQIRFKLWLTTHLRTTFGAIDDLTRALTPKQTQRLRTRYVREVALRGDDPSYRMVATAAELIKRPVRAKSQRRGVDAASGARDLRHRLGNIFPGGPEDRRTACFAQLTGLDDRHVLDLLKGANAVGEVWWEFLDAVETAIRVLPGDWTAEDAPLLRRMVAGDGYNDARSGA
jgi:hypothetical protein